MDYSKSDHGNLSDRVWSRFQQTDRVLLSFFFKCEKYNKVRILRDLNVQAFISRTQTGSWLRLFRPKLK